MRDSEFRGLRIFPLVMRGGKVRELSDIVTSLLDRDGSCRDLNFGGAEIRGGVKDLLVSLESAFGEISGTDQEGNDLPGPLGDSVLAVEENRGQVRLIFNAGVGLIRNLQVFICSEEDGSPFVELTFFPDDVKPGPFLRRNFIALAQQMQTHLRARRYYARYENASCDLAIPEPNPVCFWFPMTSHRMHNGPHLLW